MFEGYKEEFKINLKIAYPVMLGQLGQVSVGLVDNLMIGRLGSTSLAAVSTANSIFIVVLIFGIGLSTGITPLVAQADGKKQYEKIAKILSNGLIMNTVLSILMYLLITYSVPLLYMLKQPVEVIDLAVPYLKIITFSFIPLMIYQSIKQYAEGLSFTKPAMWASLIGNLVNIVLNYILIFGKFGAPELGIIGAGIGTLISRIVMLIIMYLFVSRKEEFKSNLQYFSLKSIEKSVIKKLAKIGIPTGLQMVFEVGAFASAVFIAGLISTEAIAANQIAQSLISISYMLATGFGAAATVRVGNQLGKSDFVRLRRVGMSNMILVTIMMAFFGILFVVGNEFIPSLYINDPEVIKITASLLGIAALFQLSDGIQVVGLGALRGVQDVKLPTIITFVAYWVIALPLSYYFAIIENYGTVGIWIGLGVGLTFSGVFNLLRFSKISNQLIKKYA